VEPKSKPKLFKPEPEAPHKIKESHNIGNNLVKRHSIS
jgi:hypothetical protein